MFEGSASSRSFGGGSFRRVASTIADHKTGINAVADVVFANIIKQVIELINEELSLLELQEDETTNPLNNTSALEAKGRLTLKSRIAEHTSIFRIGDGVVKIDNNQFVSSMRKVIAVIESDNFSIDSKEQIIAFKEILETFAKKHYYRKEEYNQDPDYDIWSLVKKYSKSAGNIALNPGVQKGAIFPASHLALISYYVNQQDPELYAKLLAGFGFALIAYHTIVDSLAASRNVATSEDQVDFDGELFGLVAANIFFPFFDRLGLGMDKLPAQKKREAAKYMVRNFWSNIALPAVTLGQMLTLDFTLAFDLKGGEKLANDAALLTSALVGSFGSLVFVATDKTVQQSLKGDSYISTIVETQEQFAEAPLDPMIQSFMWFCAISSVLQYVAIEVGDLSPEAAIAIAIGVISLSVAGRVNVVWQKNQDLPESQKFKDAAYNALAVVSSLGSAASLFVIDGREAIIASSFFSLFDAAFSTIRPALDVGNNIARYSTATVNVIDQFLDQMVSYTSDTTSEDSQEISFLVDGDHKCKRDKLEKILLKGFIDLDEKSSPEFLLSCADKCLKFFPKLLGMGSEDEPKTQHSEELKAFERVLYKSIVSKQYGDLRDVLNRLGDNFKALEEEPQIFNDEFSVQVQQLFDDATSSIIKNYSMYRSKFEDAKGIGQDLDGILTLFEDKGLIKAEEASYVIKRTASVENSRLFTSRRNAKVLPVDIEDDIELADLEEVDEHRAIVPKEENQSYKVVPDSSIGVGSSSQLFQSRGVAVGTEL